MKKSSLVDNIDSDKSIEMIDRTSPINAIVESCTTLQQKMQEAMAIEMSLSLSNK